MEDKLHIGDFINGKCKAVNESEKFAHDWFEINCNPCLICGKDRPKCSFCRKLVERGVTEEKESQFEP